MSTRPFGTGSKQRRYRQRCRDEAFVLRGIALPKEVVEVLVKWANLDMKAAEDSQRIEREAINALVKWSREMGPLIL